MAKEKQYLVIVESPTKAKTINKFLPKNYHVIASMGHIRDLPRSAQEIPESYKKKDWAHIGVDIENNFKPLYVVQKEKKTIVSDLKKFLKNSDELLLATDEDREGESICWHIMDILKPKIPAKRMVFHEITKTAIENALQNCREINTNLVHAQETRRVLDRLVGYTLSPLLWKKIATGLSAGRVQSVAVYLLVEKELERMRFVSSNFWGITAQFEENLILFNAHFTKIDNKKIAISKDFDETTGKLKKPKEIYLLQEQEARGLEIRLKSTQGWKVTSIDENATLRQPPAPFITSTLQQEANRKLRLTAKDSMRVAQKLYEKGYITYMRTDSVTLSKEATDAARKYIQQEYGEEYLPSKVITYKSKVRNAQEAHEAIRPTEQHFKLESAKKLDNEYEAALFELILKRTVASQMKPAKITFTTVLIDVEEFQFTTHGKRIDFHGYLKAYLEGEDQQGDAQNTKQENLLPHLKVGQILDVKQVEANEHNTKPPNRYTEASLVKLLEKEGIGRPSTYASIIDTIINRDYAEKKKDTLIPSFKAFLVNSLLKENFNQFVNLNFTAKMEEDLDKIANGTKDYLPYLNKFYKGKTGLQEQVELKNKEIEPQTFRSMTIPNIEAKLCIGKYGPFLEMEKEGERISVSVPHDVPFSELNQEKVNAIFRQKDEFSSSLGLHPTVKEPIFLLTGAYGPYVQLGESQNKKVKPKRVGLPKGTAEKDVDLEMAINLLSLPKTLGIIKEDTDVIYQVNNGRYGPYAAKIKDDEREFRSIRGDDNIFTITLERVLELFSQPKNQRSRNSTALKVIGQHPGTEENLELFKGPYGHYVKYKKKNFAIPKEIEVESITLQQALCLIDKKKTSRKKKTSTTKKK